MSYQQQGGLYGRVPPETVALFQQVVRAVREQVLAGLPSYASQELRAYTVEEVLAVVLRDWRENENTSGLLAEDIADTRWVVDEPGARIIFPNPKVKNGLRAGLLVVPVAAE